MTRLSHRSGALSTCVTGLGAVMMVLGAVAHAPVGAAVGPAKSSPLYGRWIVADAKPVFTARGRMYKTIDIAPCGNDFCGVSVADNGACGATLFRFLSKRANGESMMWGRGLWGKERKTVQIEYWADEGVAGGKSIELYLGDGHDFGGRSDNMPKFTAMYRTTGRARCLAK